jgi:hypothetical protein
MKFFGRPAQPTSAPKRPVVRNAPDPRLARPTSGPPVFPSEADSPFPVLRVNYRDQLGDDGRVGLGVAPALSIPLRKGLVVTLSDGYAQFSAVLQPQQGRWYALDLNHLDPEEVAKWRAWRARQPDHLG